MSEIIQETNTGGNTPAGESNTENTVTTSTSILNQVVESVMTLIDTLSLFATITRGALGTGNGICCEIGPSTPETVWMDKNQYIPVDLTINGKNTNLQTLSDAMNSIHESLTMKTTYPSGDKWKIIDIRTMTEPQVIERNDSGSWMMASSLSVWVATITPEPTPEPDPEPTPDPVPDDDGE